MLRTRAIPGQTLWLLAGHLGLRGTDKNAPGQAEVKSK